MHVKRAGRIIVFESYWRTVAPYSFCSLAEAWLDTSDSLSISLVWRECLWEGSLQQQRWLAGQNHQKAKFCGYEMRSTAGLFGEQGDSFVLPCKPGGYEHCPCFVMYSSSTGFWRQSFNLHPCFGLIPHEGAACAHGAGPSLAVLLC